MESSALSAADSRLEHGRQLLAQAEAHLAAGQPDALPALIQDLVRALRPLAQHADHAGLTERARRLEIVRMGQRVVAMQESVARTQAALARERTLLMPAAPASTPVYSSEGSTVPLGAAKHASAVA